MSTLTELNAERMLRMRELIEAALAPSLLEIIDDSARHAGHAGAQGGHGHFKLQISSAALTGLTMLAQHRLIYQSLGTMMQTDIHALSIKVVPV